jgi:hypothetical protein
MESTGKIIGSLGIAVKQLPASSLFRVGAVILKKALANDNFDDDPPPSAAASVRAFSPPNLSPRPWRAIGTSIGQLESAA